MVLMQLHALGSQCEMEELLRKVGITMHSIVETELKQSYHVALPIPSVKPTVSVIKEEVHPAVSHAAKLYTEAELSILAC